MSTQKVEADRGSLDRQHTRLQHRGVGKKIGAFAVAATIGLAACSGSGDTPKEENATTPASEPTAVNTVDTGTVEVASGFLDAYGAFDVEQAITYLADDADLDLFGDDWRLGNRFMEATGMKVLLDSCAVTNSTPAGTQVRCPFDYHGIRSDEIGRGPFSGNYFDLTVLEGEIVSASMQLEFMSNGFSAQMWEPFAEWVSTTYPEDAAVMYTDESLSDFRLTEESIRLWERHSREYAKVVGS